MTGEELKEWRERIGISQQELAEALSVFRQTVTRWENGERSIPSYLHLALKQVEQDQKKTDE